MAWTSPSTWADGAVVSAAQLNTQLRDNLTYLKTASDNALARVAFAPRTSQMPYSATGTYYIAPVTRNLTLTLFALALYVSGTNNGSNYWTITLELHSGAITAATLSTAASAGSAFLMLSTSSLAVSSVTTASYKAMQITCTKTGTPGDLYCAPEVQYQ